MSNKVEYNINLMGPLLIIFIVLKVTGMVTWEWVWVLCPLWLPFAIFAGCIATFAVVSGVIYFILYLINR